MQIVPLFCTLERFDRLSVCDRRTIARKRDRDN
jgi:hypothetical protein